MKRLQDRDIFQILRDTKDRKTILYGSGVFANQAVQMLACLDILVSYCIDALPPYETYVCTEKIPVCDPSHLLEEKELFFVLIAKEDIRECVAVLNGLGLHYLEHYNTIFQACARIDWLHACPLDLTLGYGMGARNVGDVRVYGNLDQDSMKIAVLGDSTSDPQIFPWKCWGECLWEQCMGEQMAVAVIVGAVAGHSSSQGVFKFIRDILQYQPDILISYSGTSDRFSRTPYATPYQMKLYRRIASMGLKDPYERQLPHEICCGQQVGDMPPADRWLLNQRILHAVSLEFGVRHVAFLQPTLICKRRGRQDEEVFFYVPEKEVKEKLAFRKRVREKMDEFDYIIDATSWLDEYDGLFYDYAHVTEAGNRIIAERVYQYLFGGCVH